MSLSIEAQGVLETPDPGPASRSALWPWLLCLGIFYALWALWNFGFGHWATTRERWPIAVAMAIGSYVAGSTPMGGGSIGFPVLVLLFDQPAAMGRNFGLLIQSVGMSSAALFILCRGGLIERRLLGFGVVGSALGLLSGTFFLVPLLPDATVKLIFACLWASFGVLTLVKNREICGFSGLPAIPWATARTLGLTIGVAGGMTTALTGVGIDMLLYIVLVLLFRMDLKAAVPTSVVAMAISSVMGAVLHLVIGDIEPEVFQHWLAAAPVVVLGAPLGAFFVTVIPRYATLYLVALLCLLQFAWTLRQVQPTALQWVFIAANLTLAGAGFVALHRAGRVIAPALRDDAVAARRR